ncbi:hypothetical protein, partial [Enterobacter hormaechei]
YMHKKIILFFLFVSLNAHGSIKFESLSLTQPQSDPAFELIKPNYSFENYSKKNDDFLIEQYGNVKDTQNEFLQALDDLKENTSFNYALWASILLGCVTIIITLISVLLALMSIVGYRNFKKSIELKVKNISSLVAKEETTKQIDYVAKKELVRLIDEGALTQHLESAVDMVYLRLRGRPDDSKDGFNKYPELDDEELEK